jgi:hypothetical protein
LPECWGQVNCRSGALTGSVPTAPIDQADGTAHDLTAPSPEAEVLGRVCRRGAVVGLLVRAVSILFSSRL